MVSLCGTAFYQTGENLAASVYPLGEGGADCGVGGVGHHLLEKGRFLERPGSDGISPVSYTLLLAHENP